MVLKRATKSIPLTGGIVEEVDDFLLEPAGMQYMENLRFTRKDSAEKIEPMSLAAVTGGANHTLNAYGIWTDGDRVSIIENNNILVSTDAGDSWDAISQDTDLLGIEKILNTAEVAGGTIFTWAPIGNFTASPRSYVISAYGVAYERIKPDTGTAVNDRDVVAQVYGLDGRLINEKIIADHCTPVMRWDDSGATLMMVDTANGDIRVELASEASLAFQFQSDSSRGVQLYNQNYNNTNDGYGAVGSELLGEDMRLGYSTDYRYNNAALAMNMGIESSIGVVSWKNELAGTISWQELLNGGPTGAVHPVTVDSGTTHYSILDCINDASNVYLLCSLTDTSLTTNQTSMYIISEPLGGGATTSWQFATGIDGPVVNGSLCFNTAVSEDLFVAYTQANGHPDQLMNVTRGQHRVHWAYLDAPLTTQAVPYSGEIYSHRLISNIVSDKNGEPVIVVQQWDNFNPDDNGTGTDPNLPALTTTHKKPVTSLLVKIDYVNDRPEVMASFDAGQSKAMSPGMEEQNIRLQNLYYFDQGIGTQGAHQYWFGNRNILVAEDDWYYVGNSTAQAWPINHGRIPLVPGTARLNVYRLQSSIPIATAMFPDGLFLGTSVPTWFDGSRELSSITALESPEIIAADMDGDGGTYIAYQDLGISGEEPIVVQAVAGYFDDNGLAHRSAPSVPVYIGNAIASTTTAIWTRVWVTPPLTVEKERTNFIEIYEALPGEVPSLVSTQHFPDGNASAPIFFRWKTNVNPTTASKDLNITPFRASKALYTAGNVLAADPWPNFDMVVKSGRRLFAHSIADESTIFYSKIFENGVSPEFSASLTISLGNEKITAMGTVDDKVIVFTRDAVWFVYGTGPDNTGANGDFFVEKLPFPIGCTSQESVLTYDDGVAFFSSTTGEFHTITRDLQIVDIGEGVQGMTSDTGFSINKGLANPELHELRWYCTRGTGVKYLADSSVNSPAQPPRPWLNNVQPTSPVFIFNYKYNKWSISSDGDFHTVGLLNNKPCGLRNWNFYKTTDTWSDATLCKWETPWIKVNQLQDYGRFYGATFLGRYLSSWEDNGGGVESGDIQITVRYDYEGALGSTDVYRFRANQEFDPVNGDRLQFRLTGLSRQKCQAVKFEIEEIATTAVELSEPTYTNGRGISLVAVDLLYGAKGGSSRTIGQRRNR